MGRRMKHHMKISMIVLAFSLLITITFCGALLWYGSVVAKHQQTSGSIYALHAAEYQEILQSGGTLQIDPNKLISASETIPNLLKGTLDLLIPVSLCFLLVLFVLSACLWVLLNRMHEKQTRLIASQIHEAATEQTISEEPALMQAYDQLRQRFDDQLADYKRLSSYLSHEQKNHIAILRAKLELAQHHEYLKTLDTITDSIDDILTISENPKSSTMGIIDVSLICAEVYDNYRRIANGITFSYEGEDDTEIFAKGRWIYRAVANLLDNAIKYGEGKPITLSVKAKHHSVIVAVCDQGIGIEEQKQERIFHEHYRVNELHRNGYGIGLSLVSHVCDLCHGFVTVESKPGAGSTFYVSFPQKHC